MSSSPSSSLISGLGTSLGSGPSATEAGHLPAPSPVVERSFAARTRPAPTSAAPASPLARSGPRELARAWSHRDRLLAAARMVLVADHGNGSAGCLPGNRCRAGVHADVCALIHRLAAIEEGPVPVLDPERARRTFEGALTDAVDAVRSCRQTDHPIGGCWFSADPANDGCGEVLQAAHRFG